MLEWLSPREIQELDEAVARGHAWAKVIRLAYDQGRGLLRLGLERARTGEEIARVAGLARRNVREACRAASRWCADHGLHLMEFPGEEGGRSWRYLMAVG